MQKHATLYGKQHYWSVYKPAGLKKKKKKKNKNKNKELCVPVTYVPVCALHPAIICWWYHEQDEIVTNRAFCVAGRAV